MIGCHYKNVKWENVKMTNVRWHMWKYEMSNVRPLPACLKRV